MKHKILEVKTGIGEGGMACGPVDGPIISEVKLQLEDGTETFYSLAEVTGIPNFFHTDKSTYEEQLAGDMDDDMVDYINEHFIETGDYDEMFDNQEEEWFTTFRYLVYLVRCPEGEEEQFAVDTIGMYIEDIDIPVSDVEEDAE